MPGGMGGGGGTVNTSQQSSTNMGPWNQQGPYLQQGFAQAGNLLQNQPWSPYPGSTVTPWNTTQSSGFQNLVNTAQNSPLYPAAQSNYLNTLNGNYLNPQSNPWLQGTFNAAAQPLMQQYQNTTAPTTASMFAGAGPMSGGAYGAAVNNNNQTLMQGLTNLASSIYGGNYQNERQNQMNALGMLPQMQGSSFASPLMMMQAGGAAQGQQQAELQGQIGQYYAGQQLPWQQLGQYQGIVGSNNWGQSGTTSTQSQQPYFTNPASTALGGALGLGSLATPGMGGTSALGNIFGSNGLGGLLGGLGGMFGSGGAAAAGTGGLDAASLIAMGL